MVTSLRDSSLFKHKIGAASLMSQEPFHIEESEVEIAGRRVLRLSGTLWLSAVAQFHSVVKSDTDQALVLDMTEVPMVDSAGVAALVALAVPHQKQGHPVALVGVSERVRKTLHVTQVEQFFRFFWNMDEATEELAR
jgi:anti-anti-sigma factor